jgi:DNA adenine methylase
VTTVPWGATYVTGHNNNGFIDYNETLFAWKDRISLAGAAAAAAKRGAHVIVTNANHADLRSLYPDFDILTVSRSSTIASSATKRQVVEEVLIYFRP